MKIEGCCDTDAFTQLCGECDIAYSLMEWGLKKVAVRFRSNPKSKTFQVKQVWVDRDGIYFGLQAKTTREKVIVLVAKLTIDRAKTRVLSAKNKIKKP